MKKETRNTSIKWSIYGVLVIATILTFVFSKEIFGYNYHQVLDMVFGMVITSGRSSHCSINMKQATHSLITYYKTQSPTH